MCWVHFLDHLTKPSNVGAQPFQILSGIVRELAVDIVCIGMTDRNSNTEDSRQTFKPLRVPLLA